MAVRVFGALRQAGAGKLARHEARGSETVVRVPLPAGATRAAVRVKFLPKGLRVALAGEDEPLLDGSLPGSIDLDGCYWELEPPPPESEDAGGPTLVVALEHLASRGREWDELLESDLPEPADRTVTARCYLDFAVNDEPPARVEVALYGNHVPRTAANFVSLCVGDATGTSGEPLCFRDSPVHRIIPGFVVQAGDITAGDGTGGESIYGESFDDESTQIKHDAPMQLSMANRGPNTNGSQFFVTLAPSPHLDGKHVVFGHVLEGEDVIRRLGEMGTPSGTPIGRVRIVDCGQLRVHVEQPPAEA